MTRFFPPVRRGRRAVNTPELPTDATLLESAEHPVDESRPSWRTGNRTILVLAAVAVVALVAGLGLSRLVVNPADAAARTRPPEAGPITVPVERRTLSNDVTMRGDATSDNAVDLRVETADLGERAVVTGRVPEVGATLDAGSVALEIAGRPTIVLPSQLPAYRTLRAGVSGPDVAQLKAALGALGIAAGNPASDTYDAATAAGVVALYQRAGYPAPTAGTDAADALRSAEEGMRTAQADVLSAENALARASRGATTPSQIAEADARVRAAARARDTAQVAADDLNNRCADPVNPPEDCSASARTGAQKAVEDAQDQIGVAAAQRAELDARTDTSLEQGTLNAARQTLTEAKSTLTKAREATLTPLPASEIVYVETLPRRVDNVKVRRGGTVEGPVMSVSGAKLEVTATASAANADLLKVGSVGSIPLDDAELPVTVTKIEKASGAKDGSGASGDAKAAAPADAKGGTSGRYTITLSPGELTDAQITALRGSNVRVTMPVSSTGGDVLAVPLAALTAGPGGESRVEVKDDDGTTRLVKVTTGLAAGGYVEITGSEPGIAEGAMVVVGQSGSSADPDSDDSGDKDADA